ncbi:MAG: hypothetical protein LUF92_12945 [Clostridiales bacterium]|nr:hypothetical protein [Clostridiales bacterium]
MHYFKNHFGLIISIYVALFMSVSMATVGVLWNAAEAGIHLENWILNWGAAFLSFTLVSIILPVKMIGDKAAQALKLKEEGWGFFFLSNAVRTLFFNTVVTIVLTGCGMGFDNPYLWAAIGAQILPMYIISFLFSCVYEKLAFRIACSILGQPPYKVGD